MQRYIPITEHNSYWDIVNQESRGQSIPIGELRRILFLAGKTVDEYVRDVKWAREKRASIQRPRTTKRERAELAFL